MSPKVTSEGFTDPRQQEGSIADRLFQPELPPLSRSCPAWHFQFCLECDKSWNAFASYRFAKWKITQRESVCWRGRSVPRQERVMRQVYASRKWRRKTVRRATHVELIGWSLFSSSPLSCAAPRSTRKNRHSVNLELKQRSIRRSEAHSALRRNPANYGSLWHVFT